MPLMISPDAADTPDDADTLIATYDAIIADADYADVMAAATAGWLPLILPIRHASQMIHASYERAAIRHCLLMPPRFRDTLTPTYAIR